MICEELIETAPLCELLRTKAAEWEIAPVSVDALCERFDMFHALTWRQIVEAIEQIATGVDLTEGAAPAPAAATGGE